MKPISSGGGLVVDLDLLGGAAGVRAGGRERHHALGDRELDGPRLLGRDGRDAVDGVGELLARHVQDLVVAGRDHPLVVGEGAVDQLADQGDVADGEADAGVGKLDIDRAVALVEQLADLAHGLARHDHARDLAGALGQRHLDPGQAMAVGRHAAQHVGVARLGGMEIDAVQVVARLLVGDGEARAVDDALEVGRRDLEAVRQVALVHRREVGRRQALQGEARAAGADGEAVAVARGLELDLGAVGQLAHDLVEGVGGRGGGAGLGGVRVDRFGDGEVHVGRGEAEAALLGGDQHVRQDGDRVPAFDDTLHMGEGLQERCPFDRQFHGLVAINEGQNERFRHPVSRARKGQCGTVAEYSTARRGGKRFRRRSEALKPS